MKLKTSSFVALTFALGLFAGCSPATPKDVAAPEPPTTTNAKATDGDAFLAATGKKPGIVTTASGLEYKVLKSGSGASPKATDQVKVHYTGMLVDGTVFDSSVSRGQPAVFPVNAVIPGWTEALQLMKVGDKWQLFIPAKLAYGAQSPSPAIPSNSVLVFEVELLGIE
jgi:FKBP-type peptidyl-prolyl cis-trans isomerase FklB